MASTNRALRAWLIDDHPAVRQGLALLLEHNGMEICAQDDSASAALQSLPEQDADLALVDLSFERDEGFDLISALCAKSIRVIVYSMHEDSSHVSRSLACGALAYVSKRENSSILLHGIAEACQNREYLSPRVCLVIEAPEEDITSPIPRCSAREIQILHLLGQGLGNNEIADSLDLSVRTIETYCMRIYNKLELAGMKELRQFAIRLYRTADNQ